MLSIQMNNMMQMLRRQTGCGRSSSTNAHVTCCSIYGGEHNPNECINVEQAQFVNNYNMNVHNNPYSNTYNSGVEKSSKFWMKISM